MTMDHLIARRNRVRDMLAELENDAWTAYGDKELREVLSDEAMVELKINQGRIEQERKQVAKGNGWNGLVDVLPEVVRHKGLLAHAKDKTKNALKKLEYWDAQMAEVERMMAVFNGHIRDAYGEVKRSWAKLSERERACFARPQPNPHNALGYPDHHSDMAGVFYPEWMPRRTVSVEKLREALEEVEREIAEEGGEA